MSDSMSDSRHLLPVNAEPGAVRAWREGSNGTCDWGDGCMSLAAAERYDPYHGWLPVCQVHRDCEYRSEFS